MFVSTNNGPRVYILKNEVVLSYFTTICTTIGTLLVDQFGYVAVFCSDTNTVQMYSTNGTYLGLHWQSMFPSTFDIEFDNSGNLVVSGSNGVVLLNSISTPISLASTDSVCIINSNFTKSLQNYFHLNSFFSLQIKVL